MFDQPVCSGTYLSIPPTLLNLSALLMVLRASSFLPTDICHLGDSGRKKKRRTTDSMGIIDAIWNCLQSAMHICDIQYYYFSFNQGRKRIVFARVYYPVQAEAMRETTASPMAKGIWMALPATVFHFGPTISTVMLNPIMNRPIAPAALKGTDGLSMVQQSIDGRVDILRRVDGWVDELISQSVGQNERMQVKLNCLCSCPEKKLALFLNLTRPGEESEDAESRVRFDERVGHSAHGGERPRDDEHGLPPEAVRRAADERSQEQPAHVDAGDERHLMSEGRIDLPCIGGIATA